MNAHRLGYEAFFNGTVRERNPYRAARWRREWFTGWDLGRNDYRDYQTRPGHVRQDAETASIEELEAASEMLDKLRAAVEKGDARSCTT